jgi:hypothetical protein
MSERRAATSTGIIAEVVAAIATVGDSGAGILTPVPLGNQPTLVRDTDTVASI